jgi:L-methionine (R)-S-oxide reductase
MIAKEICQILDRLKGEGADLDTLLNQAVQLLHKSNDKFHWTGIYELFPDNTLRLGPFVGEATDHKSISVGQGVCGSAVADRSNKNIPDVTRESNYLACSSSTKSELVVLIRKGERIYAQIDIDSHEYDAFNPDWVAQVEIVADWLADAYAGAGA